MSTLAIPSNILTLRQIVSVAYATAQGSVIPLVGGPDGTLDTEIAFSTGVYEAKGWKITGVPTTRTIWDPASSPVTAGILKGGIVVSDAIVTLLLSSAGFTQFPFPLLAGFQWHVGISTVWTKIEVLVASGVTANIQSIVWA